MVSASDLNVSQTEPGKQLNHSSNPQFDRKIYQGSIQPKGFPSLPEGWVSEWETFPASDGKLQLFSVIHHPKEWTGKRVLVVLHGLGEHGGRYLHFPHYLQSTVDAIYCLDHRGHGRSEGIRGDVAEFDLFADDVALAVNRLDESLKKRFGHSEIHFYGHSLGGLIALRTLFKYPTLPIQSAAVSAPLIAIGMKVPPIKKLAAAALTKIWGTVQLTSEIDARLLSHDLEVVETYVTDRLNHSKVTPRFFFAMLKILEDTAKRNSGIQHPLQMMIPLQDKVVNPNVSLQFFRELKLRDKQLKTYADFFHEPFNEIGKEQAFEDLASWIQSHSVR